MIRGDIIRFVFILAALSFFSCQDLGGGDDGDKKRVEQSSLDEVSIDSKPIKELTYTILETDYFQFSLPEEWVEFESDNSQSYYESPDSTLGLYVYALKSSSNLFTLEKIAKNLEIDEQSLAKIEGSSFMVLAKTKEQLSDLVLGSIEAIDFENKHQIYINYFASDRVMVRLSFHDYSYQEEGVNLTIIQEILGSFELK